MDGKGQLRSVWTQAVSSSSWRESGSPSSDPEHQPGSPSKAPINPHLMQLQESVKQRSCRLCSLDKEILCNALACAGASMADPLMSMVDTYYAGKLGTTALAALGANGALYSVIYFLCFTALAVLCTQSMAAANSRRDAVGCGRGFLQAVAATWVVSFVLVGVLLLAPDRVLSLFAEAKVMPYAKTYCMIRALSLPAALSINVCQAAFRSLLDLVTPFCVVMAANAANYLLDQLLMFGFGWGMAGCGWASVISQYIGATMFAAIIYRKRHQFGIPEALTAATEDYTAHQHKSGKQRWLFGTVGRSWSARKRSDQTTEQHSSYANKLKAGCSVERKDSDSYRINLGSPLRALNGRGASPVRLAAVDSPSDDSTAVVTARAASLLHRVAASNHTAIDTQGVMLDVTLTGQGVTRRVSAAEDPARLSAGSEDSAAGHAEQPQRYHSPKRRQQKHRPKHHDSNRAPRSSSESPSWGEAVRRMFDYRTPAGRPAHSVPGGAHIGTAPLQPSVATSRDGAVITNSAVQHHQDSSAGPSGSTMPVGLPDDSSSDGSRLLSDSGFLRRLDSVGSDSKLPRLPTQHNSLQRLLMLLCTLEWSSFVWRFLGMTVRGLLILSTYTSANLVAAAGGASMMAAHQVVQQQQQLQMSFAWSFLHVGQSMTANVYHAKSSAGGGPKAARLLAQRIINWSTGSCIALALLTYSNRWALSGIFTRDVAVRKLVARAAAPATVMLSIAYNNAIEGCLLAAGDQPYVVRVYPWAATSGVIGLGLTRMYGWGLPGVWWGLMLYYLVLLLGFAARFWVRRVKI